MAKRERSSSSRTKSKSPSKSLAKAKTARATRGVRPSRREPPYRVARSGIHGRGVFATRLIRRGTRVLEYRGEIVGAAEAERRARRSKHVYIFDLENGKFIDGDPTSDAAYVNHSCEPNCVVDVKDDRVFVVADRAIRPGEELTYDYSFDADTDVWRCACSKTTCRGTINVVEPEPPNENAMPKSRPRKKRRAE